MKVLESSELYQTEDWHQTEEGNIFPADSLSDFEIASSPENDPSNVSFDLPKSK